MYSSIILIILFSLNLLIGTIFYLQIFVTVNNTHSASKNIIKLIRTKNLKLGSTLNISRQRYKLYRALVLLLFFNFFFIFFFCDF